MLRAEGVDLSEEFLNWAAKQRDGLPNEDGTTLTAAAAALAELGQPPEEGWPYDEGRDQRTPKYQPPDGASEAAIDRRLPGGSSLESTATDLRAALAEGKAVLLGVRLHLPWFSPSPEGNIAMPPSGSSVLGGHAVLVVGYLDGDGEGGGQFIVRNSWGADWGADGYGFVPYAYVDLHGIQAWGLELEESGGRDA